ncbi:NACHT domain-containing protein [Micromonospora sp. H61]|uniref:NACHT domain-containing protein n=1 Tax=Micromonospora sp. H61 TaxID=2824888 RepID=UPI001B376788|nr:NACHT domain-containing protein [Micromonospora sp. H61]MBQ0990702.1 NACHT domain-containing protein [Micromonospora sp. H61]
METALLRAATSAITPALNWWVGRRRDQRERSSSLIDLVNSGIFDDLGRRRATRRVDEIVDAVYERLRPLVHGRYAGLADHEVAAAFDAVADTFSAADLSDEALFADDIDPVRLAARLRQALPTVPEHAGLGELAGRLYVVALEESCACLTQLVVQLRPFQGRASVELLERLTEVAAVLSQVLARLPTVTLDAPAGTDLDGQFRDRYLGHLLITLNFLELFGVDIHRYRLRTPLSAAYISLAVSGTTGHGSLRDVRWDPGLLRRDLGGLDDASVRVERALGGARRLLIRGQAGSGKTTLLQWIAVSAARAGFVGELTNWNGSIPFLIRLRGYVGRPLPRPEEFLDGVAEPLVGLMPSGWVHRRLADRAVLCVDGVDEVPEGERRGVREWLRGLLAAYPKLRVVVTSRPAAAAGRWLQGEDFTAANLERMGPADVRALIRHWHEAVRAAGDVPCEPHELAGYEQRLLAQVDGTAHLQALAASPLLCAMLCALNLDRDSQLPRNRMDIYQAAVNMLLERRDVQRGVRTSLPDLNSRDRLQLLQQLAWWLTLNGRVELTRDEALQQLTQRLAGMRQVAAPATVVLDNLLQRSGILLETVPDRVHFVHRTFQEYLAAREAAEQGHAGALINHAHLDTWRETVVLAVGHANAPVRRTLLTGILDRANTELRQARRLRLLAAACLETAPSVEPPELLDRVRAGLHVLLPPRSTVEARSLAGVGEPLLAELTTTRFEGLTEAQAVAVIRATALVNGPAAMDVLAGIAADPRRRVQQELIAVWEYFDPFQYADQVLSGAPLENGEVTVHSAGLLPALPLLKRLTASHLDLYDSLDLAQLSGVPQLRSLYLRQGFTGDLNWLTGHPGLQSVDLWLEDGRADLSILTALPDLRRLWLRRLADDQDLNMIGDLTELRGLWLIRAPIGDLGFIAGCKKLEFLFLAGAASPDLAVLTGLVRLDGLVLDGVAEPVGGLDQLTQMLPHLTWLSLVTCEWLRDLRLLRRLEELKHLGIQDNWVRDLAPLADLRRLRSLTIGAWQQPNDGSERPFDLTPLARLQALRQLMILESPPGIDLRPLRGRRITVSLTKTIQLADTGPVEGLTIKRY